MAKVRIMQWWYPVSMVYGTDTLKDIIDRERRYKNVENLKIGECYAFMNRKRDTIKILGWNEYNQAVTVAYQKLPDKQTWDVLLEKRKEQIFKLALSCFGMELKLSNKAVSRGWKISENFEVDHPRKAAKLREARKLRK